MMRQCGWLSAKEMAQCFPRKLQHLTGTKFETTEFSWEKANSRAIIWSIVFSAVNRKYAIDERQRLTHYFSHVIPETGYLRLMKEGDNKTGTYLSGKKYYPYYGRGLIQLTWAEAYKKYGTFRSFPITERAPAIYSIAGWNPDVLIATSDSVFNAVNCADSAGYYIASHSSMLSKMDEGISKDDAVKVSRCVNGEVAIQNLNGLDARLQSIVLLKYVLLDFVNDDKTEELKFEWRRDSAQENTGALSANGKPKKAFILKSSPWVLDVFLDKQRP